MRCLTLDQILDFLQGRVTQDENTEYAAHLSTGCPSCREEYQWLEEVSRLKTYDNSFDAPEELIQWMVAQFKVHSAGFRSGFRRFWAELIFDSLGSPRMSAVRAERTDSQSSSPRQLLYHVDGYDIDLRFEQIIGGESIEMVGQVLPDQALVPQRTPYIIRLIKDEIEIQQTFSDPSGMFIFDPAPSGIFDLKVEVPEGEINISQIINDRVSREK